MPFVEDVVLLFLAPKAFTENSLVLAIFTKAPAFVIHDKSSADSILVTLVIFVKKFNYIFILVIR
jgi:hypothetical protein